MKILLLFALFTMFSCSSGSVEVAEREGVNPYIDEEYGFRSHHFGDHLSTFEGVKFLKNARSKDVKTYGLVEGYEDDWKLGPVKLTSIAYDFYHDSLCQVLLVCNANQKGELLKIFRNRYGMYVQPDSSKELYQWNGKKVFATYFAPSLGDTLDTGMLITSAAMAKRINKD